MESYCSLCTLDTIHRLVFVTRLIINKINKVQWVDFKLGNVLVSLNSLITMGLGPFGAFAPLFLRNGELLGHSPIRHVETIKVNQRRQIIIINYSRVCNMSSMTCATCGAGHAFPSEAHDFTPCFSGVHVTRFLVLPLVFCPFWFLYCVSFSLRLMITLLIS